jgi:uncharacterized protein
MKYLRLFENFEDYDPYELMIIPPNKKAKMIMDEIKKSEPNLNLVQDLITMGADINWYDEKDYNYTPLHAASSRNRPEIVKMLIDAGAELNVQTSGGLTPLHRTIPMSNSEVAKILIDAGADLNIQEVHGWTPLHWAIENKENEIKQMLIDAGAIIDIKDNRGKKPFDLIDSY